MFARSLNYKSAQGDDNKLSDWPHIKQYKTFDAGVVFLKLNDPL